MMVCRQCWSPWEPTETTALFAKWIFWKCSWNTLSSTCLIKIFIVALPLTLANFNQLYDRHLSNYISYLMQKSRFVCISVHTISIHKNWDIHNHIGVRNATEVSHYKVAISLLFFQSFTTCLVYKVQTSLASFFSIITSKSSQVSALLGRLIHNHLAQERTSFKKSTVWTYWSCVWTCLNLAILDALSSVPLRNACLHHLSLL